MNGFVKKLPAVCAGLCAGCLLLVLLDWIAPSWNLFLKPVTQWLIALSAVALIASGGALANRDRKRLRRKLRRQKG